MKKLNKYTKCDRIAFFIGEGWHGLKVHDLMISNNIGSMEYDIGSYVKNDNTYVITWSKEAKTLLRNKGYKITNDIHLKLKF